MSGQQPRDILGTRVMSGMVPAKYDQVAHTYSAGGLLTSSTFYYAGVILSVLHFTYDGSGYLTNVTVQDT